MTTEYAHADSADSIAALGQEIKLLVDMVVEHAAPWLDGLVAAGHGGSVDDAGQHGGSQDHTGSAEQGTETRGAACGWCPLCAVVAMARGERPEISSRVLDQAAQLVALLRAVLADRWYPGEGVHTPGFVPSAGAQAAPPRWPKAESAEATGKASSESPRPPSSRVQRIPVRKVGERPSPRPGEF